MLLAFSNSNNGYRSDSNHSSPAHSLFENARRYLSQGTCIYTSQLHSMPISLPTVSLGSVSRILDCAVVFCQLHRCQALQSSSRVTSSSVTAYFLCWNFLFGSLEPLLNFTPSASIEVSLVVTSLWPATGETNLACHCPVHTTVFSTILRLFS